jgi:release factor glutamine methyltransferase
LGHVLKRDRSFILGHAEDAVSEEQAERFRQFLERRAQGEPLQYITGHQEFYGLDFEVTPAVLIPRPETELLIETALKLFPGLDERIFICDVGTGSGCIAVTLLHELPQARALAIDISTAALEVAKRNAVSHEVTERIEFVESDCFSALNAEDPRQSHFNLIVANPPYVEEGAISGLQREVRNFEPLSALAAGVDGLAVIRRLLLEAGNFLTTGGHFVFEIGFEQSAAVKQLVSRETWKLLDVYNDLQGIPRVMALEKQGKSASS